MPKKTNCNARVFFSKKCKDFSKHSQKIHLHLNLIISKLPFIHINVSILFLSFFLFFFYLYTRIRMNPEILISGITNSINDKFILKIHVFFGQVNTRYFYQCNNYNIFLHKIAFSNFLTNVFKTLVRILIRFIVLL